MIPYNLNPVYVPPITVDVPTAWREVVPAIAPILRDFNVHRQTCLEFGVDYGYSTAVFANYFDSVIGVDTFLGDGHAGYRDNLLAQTQNALKGFKNITLVQSDFHDFIKETRPQYNLIHIDIFHELEPTFECGRWSIDHADVVLLHDTRAFPGVMQACELIAQNTGCKFYEWPVQHGLGILVR